jgi:hypothetical protein
MTTTTTRMTKIIIQIRSDTQYKHTSHTDPEGTVQIGSFPQRRLRMVLGHVTIIITVIIIIIIIT